MTQFQSFILKSIVFSYEKRIDFDDSDVHACYWADNRIEDLYLSRRLHSGGGVMIWNVISWNGNKLFLSRKT